MKVTVLITPNAVGNKVMIPSVTGLATYPIYPAKHRQRKEQCIKARKFKGKLIENIICVLKQGILPVCVRRQCCVGKPTCVLRVFLPEEGRLSAGCSAGSNAGALPPSSAFPCWKEAPFRAEKVKLCCHPRRMGRCVAEEELLGSPAGLGSGVAAAGALQRAASRGSAATEPGCRCLFPALWLPWKGWGVCKPPFQEFRKSARA